MKIVNLFMVLLLLPSCATMKDTIAGGAEGKVDYCITFLGSNLMCVNAERDLTKDKEE
jgi:hypothetical protein